MSKIIVKSNTCLIKDEKDINFLQALDKELSFKIMGAQFMKSFKGWDGIHRILTTKLSFPFGLLGRVLDLYSYYNKKVEIEDLRGEKTPIQSISILENLKKLNKYPRQYQFDALEAVKNNSNGIIKAPTGFGKTILSAMMTAHFNKSTIIYVISKDLLYQTRRVFQSIFDQPIGIIGDGLCEIHDINIASIWTVGKAVGFKGNILIEAGDDHSEKELDPQKYKDIKVMMRDAQLHVFDEIQICSANVPQTIAKHINPEYIYGMSASPWRDDGADLLIECIFGKKIVDINASSLIREGYLVKPIIKFLDVPKCKDKMDKVYATIYKNCIIDNQIRNDKIVKGAVRLVEQGFQTLVSYSRISHGQLLYNELSKIIPCILLSGKDSAEVREDAKYQLESGKIKAILASTIFDIGVDLPSLSGLVISGAGKSSVRSLQRIGRVIRPYPNKKIAAVIDFYDKERFLKKHAMERKKIYSIEEEFVIKWPTSKH